MSKFFTKFLLRERFGEKGAVSVVKKKIFKNIQLIQFSCVAAIWQKPRGNTRHRPVA